MKKILFVYLASAALVFATAFEISPTVGGVHPFGLSKVDDHMTYGLRFGMNTTTWLDQVEFGYDYSPDIKYDGVKDAVDFNRFYLNAIKDLDFKIANKLKVYGLLGLGYEDANGGPDDLSSPFAQYGAGAKYYFSEYFALRAEARHAVRFEDGDSNFFYTLGFVIPLGQPEKPVVVKEEPKPEPKPEPVVVEPVKEERPIEIVIKDEPIIDQPEPELTDLEKTVLQALEMSAKGKRHYNFNFDKFDILPSDKDVAKNVASDLKQFDDIRVRAEGHTDSKGSKWYNLRLSQKRAQIAKEELGKEGIALDRIETYGLGAQNPVKPNDTEEGRAANRRAELIFVAPISYFEFNSAKLLPEGEQVIKLLADKAKEYASVKVRVEGHTDSKGSKFYNLKLSQKRAEAVKDELVKDGLPNDRVTAQGYGEDKPLASNDSEEGRAKNRRVDVIFINPAQ